MGAGILPCVAGFGFIVWMLRRFGSSFVGNSDAVGWARMFRPPFVFLQPSDRVTLRGEGCAGYIFNNRL